jgi:hypothetical protein
MIAPLALLLPVCPISDPSHLLRLPIALQAVLVLLAVFSLAHVLRQAARRRSPPEGPFQKLQEPTERTAASPLTQLTKESQ